MQARDGRTDRRTDRQSATQYAAPSYGGGPHNKGDYLVLIIMLVCVSRLVTNERINIWYHTGPVGVRQGQIESGRVFSHTPS